jgi:hypothetical protein
MSSSKPSQKLNLKLNELANSTENVGKLATEVKKNQSKLLHLANSTISYISQLKSDFKKKTISSNDLADKLIETMKNIKTTLNTKPDKADIDNTLEQLEQVLQGETVIDSEKPSSVDTDESTTNESEDDKSEKNDPEKTNPKKTDSVEDNPELKKSSEGKGLIARAFNTVNTAVENLLDKPNVKELEVDKSEVDNPNVNNQKGGFRYRSSDNYKSKKSKKSKRSTKYLKKNKRSSNNTVKKKSPLKKNLSRKKLSSKNKRRTSSRK